MRRNVCNGCQFMPQVSSAVDVTVRRGGGIQCAASRPDACSKFFRQQTEQSVDACLPAAFRGR